MNYFSKNTLWPLNSLHYEIELINWIIIIMMKMLLAVPLSPIIPTVEAA